MGFDLFKPAVLTALAALALTLVSPTGSAASFDCDKARAADEKAICANRSLNDQDVSMALLYDLNRHFLAMGGRDALMDAQAAWLRQRHGCGAKVGCLSDLYAQRIKVLRGFIDERVATKGPF